MGYSKWGIASYSQRPPVTLLKHQSRHPKLFWDLDNIKPRSITSLSSLSRLLRSTASTITGSQDVDFEIFANQRTLSAFAEDYIHANDTITDAALASKASDTIALSVSREARPSSSAVVIPTSPRKQSADLALRNAVMEHIRDMTLNQSIRSENFFIGCISDDTDFSHILQYCSTLGIVTLSFGLYQGHKRPSWARPKKIDTCALPRGSHIAVRLKRNVDDVYNEKWGVSDIWYNPRYQNTT